MTRILFLDVDGVLNGHDRYANGYCWLDTIKLEWLHRIVVTTDCKLVLASSWRYLILLGSMTLQGFRNLLLSHGASQGVASALQDHLPEDGRLKDLHNRGWLARKWIDAWNRETQVNRFRHPVTAVCALDDGSYPEGYDLGYESNDIPSVRPRCNVGLTESEAQRVIEILTADEIVYQI